MKKIHFSPLKKINCSLSVQGDKSISHRAIIIGSLASGVTTITNFLEAEDTQNTMKTYRELGVQIEKKGALYLVHGRGKATFREPAKMLYVGNSGTSIRLSLGVLASQPFTCSITGDAQIVKRPMKRVIEPLTKMGGRFDSNNGYAPVTIHGSQLHGIKYTMPMASAQVKSAIMLAALRADSKTEITEPVKSRDHTERMLRYFGADIRIKKNKITVTPGAVLKGRPVFVPGDISSAAYFMIAGCMVKNAKVTVKDVGLNPSRTGIIEMLRKMGAKIKIKNLRDRNGEPVGDILCTTSNLKGTTIKGAMIPKLIDEIPVIAVAAAWAKGKTVIKDAGELRFKETDRIKTVIKNLKRIGVKVNELEDGMEIFGGNRTPFKYADIDSFGDHRIAMAFSVAALAADNGLLIKDIDCVNTSFPQFFGLMKGLEGK